ncbi:MAG TPA: uroporphyrinogen-III synthase [Acidobacteriaceae bacterium]|nr:uroporphyrinogen-III synthase [Acidobacteriaceae bacterium]
MKSLAGRRILITRARHQAGALYNALQTLGAQVIAIPTIEIIPPDSYAALDDALLSLARYHWLVLTSANGVAAMWDQMQALNIDPEILQSVQLAAVGPATAHALQKRGWMVHVTPKEYVAESVVNALRDQVAGKRVLLIRAKIARDVIPEELTRLGADVRVVEAYQTVMPQDASRQIKSIFADPAGYPEIVTFTSSSTVENFFILLHEAELDALPEGILIASIGPITSQTLRKHGIEPDVEAENHSIPGFVDAMTAYFSN